MGRRYQSKEFTQDQVKDDYGNYLCESTNRGASSQETLSKPSKWSEVKSKKIMSFQTVKLKNRKLVLML